MLNNVSASRDGLSLLPRGLTPREFYEAIDRAIGINSIYGLIRSGRLKSVRIGNRYVIPVTEVNDFFLREAGKR